MTTRLLCDEYDVFYDMLDIFSSAQKGTAWTDRWMCRTNRSIQVGDRVFILNRSYYDYTSDAAPGEDPYRPVAESEQRGIVASGRIVAAEADDQLCLQDPAYADLSPAYCEDPLEMDPTEEGEILFVRVDFEAVVDPFKDAELLINWLKQQPGGDSLHLEHLASGDSIDEETAVFLTNHWEAHIQRLEPLGLALRLP